MLTKQDEVKVKNIVENAVVDAVEDTIIPAMETMHKSLNDKMDKIEGRMGEMEGRMGRVEDRMEVIQRKFDRAYDATVVQRNKIEDHENRIKKLEKTRSISL